jgi:hypothetical protein
MLWLEDEINGHGIVLSILSARELRMDKKRDGDEEHEDVR